MMPSETVTHHLVSMGPLPWWLSLALAIVLLVVVAICLRHEIGRRGQRALVKWVFVARLGVALLLGLLLAQPVLHIRREKTRAADLVVIADRSKSMLRKDSYSGTEQFDLAVATGLVTLADRNTDVQAAADYLNGETTVLAASVRTIQDMTAQLSQELPWGPAFGFTIQSERQAWDGRLATLKAHNKRVHALNQSAAEGDDTSKKYDPAVFERFDALNVAVGELATALNGLGKGPVGIDKMYGVGQQYERILAAWIQTTQDLRSLQAQSDQAHWAGLAAAEREKIEGLSVASRFDLAKRLVVRSTAEGHNHAIRLQGWDELTAGIAEAETDLFAPLEAAITASTHETLSGVVVISDGGQNLPDRPDVLRRMAARDIPFVVVGVGQDEAQVDVAIQDYRIPKILQLKKPAELVATINTACPEGSKIDVRLMAGDKAVASRQVQADGARELQVSLPFKVPDVESREWTLTAKTETPDAEPANDSVSFDVTLTKRAYRALVVAPAPTWDVVHLMRAFGRQPCRVDTVFWGGLEEGKQPKRGVGSGKIPNKLSQLRKFNVVVLVGAAFLGMTDADVAMFGQYVNDEGGNLLLVTDAKGSSTMPKLGGLFDVMAGATIGEGGVEPAPSARWYPAVALAADGTRSLGKWREFHANPKVLPVAGQTVPLLGQDETHCFSVGFYGRGAVYQLGLSEIFRLREWNGGAAVSRLFGALAEDSLRPIFADDKAVTALYPRLPVVGSTAYLICGNAEAVPASLTMGEATVSTTNVAKPGKPAILSFPVTTAGALTVALNDGSKQPYATTHAVSSETIHLNLNEDYLKQLAKSGQGQYTPLVGMNELLSKMEARTVREVSSREIRLWNLPIVLGLIVLLCVLDWVCRRRCGLVL